MSGPIAPLEYPKVIESLILDYIDDYIAVDVNGKLTFHNNGDEGINESTVKIHVLKTLVITNGFKIRNVTDIIGNVKCIGDMSDMFSCNRTFNGDISNWDVSNVTNMRHMFRNAASFNDDISNWDVSNVIDMQYMFWYATSFNGDISGWDVSKVRNMCRMFCGAAAFSSDISGWDVSQVRNMCHMFAITHVFNGDISNWNVSNVANMHGMFHEAASFNGNISNWDMSGVTNMNRTHMDGVINDSRNRGSMMRLLSWCLIDVHIVSEYDAIYVAQRMTRDELFSEDMVVIVKAVCGHRLIFLKWLHRSHHITKQEAHFVSVKRNPRGQLSPLFYGMHEGTDEWLKSMEM